MVHIRMLSAKNTVYFEKVKFIPFNFQFNFEFKKNKKIAFLDVFYFSDC